MYANRYEQSGYDDLQPVVGGKPMTIGECAKLPTPAGLAARPRGVFFMAWAELLKTDNTPEAVRAP